MGIIPLNKKSQTTPDLGQKGTNSNITPQPIISRIKQISNNMKNFDFKEHTRRTGFCLRSDKPNMFKPKPESKT